MSQHPKARNLALACALSALFSLRFGFAVWVLYYLLFTDYAGIGLAEAVVLLTAFVVEVPTGALADRIGRRPTLLLAFATLTVGYLLLASVQGLATLLAALAVIALGRALYSGTFEALLYDSLRELARELDYPRLLARTNACGLVAGAAATVVGGLLYSQAPRLPYLASAAGQAVAFVLTLGLREPAATAHRGDSGRLLTRQALAQLLGGARQRAIVVPLLIVGSLAVVSDELIDDVVAVELGFDARQLGLLFAVVYLVAASIQALAPVLTQRLGPRTQALLLGSAVAVTLVAVPWLGKQVGGAAIVLRAALRSLLATLSSSAVNRLTTSATRATTLSTFRLLLTLPYITSVWSIGRAMDRISGLAFAALFGAASLIVLVGYAALSRGPWRSPGKPMS